MFFVSPERLGIQLSIFYHIPRNVSRDFEKKFLYFKNNGRCASYTSSTANAVPLPLEGKAGVLLNPLGFPFEGKLPEGVMRCSLRSKRYPYDSSCANNGHCVSYTSSTANAVPLPL